MASPKLAVKPPTPSYQQQNELQGAYDSTSRSYRVKGRMYQPMKSRRGYIARGMASWYGPKFHGRKTANGERFNMYHMTAAHKTLPLPSYVQVTNLENGRQTIVKINDRGPFVGNRLIDLSYAAAQKLGVHARGTAAVEVRSIDRPIAWTSDADGIEVAQAAAAIANASVPSRDLASQAPAQLAAKTRASGPSATAGGNRVSASTSSKLSGRYLQVGAFEDLHNAEELRRALAAASLQNQVAINPLENNGKTLYRVWVGPIDEASNDNVVYNLTRLGIGQRPVVTP